MKRAAHFLLIPELLYSPPNDAIINAYLTNGYVVDVYAPGDLPRLTDYGNYVSTHRVCYSWTWIVRNIFRFRWLRYRLLSATSEDPLAVLALLQFLYKKRGIALVDEIKAGSYRGDRSELWKNICKWGIRRSTLQIVNDSHRVHLLQDYINLKKSSSIMVYPGCFKDTPTDKSFSRSTVRKRWNIPPTSFVIGSSGGFNLTSGADWLIRSISEMPDMYAVIQPLGASSLSLFMMSMLECSKRIYVETKRLTWKEAWISSQALDVGICIYTNQAPQFQHMGISSNRLCMFLAMGVPVIASRQKSFEFIEAYNCGVLVDSYNDFKKAIDHIKMNHRVMSENCIACHRLYIKPQDYYKDLTEKISRL